MEPRNWTQFQDACEVPGLSNRACGYETRVKNEGASCRREDLDSNHTMQNSFAASGSGSRTRQWRIDVLGVGHRPGRKSNRGKCLPHNSLLAGRERGGATRATLITESAGSIQQKRLSSAQEHMFHSFGWLSSDCNLGAVGK
jgi:hypothetical protein